MTLPGWMKIGDKSTLETLAIWGLPLLLLLAVAFAIYGSFVDNTPDFGFPV